jgi:hypothetical protein
VKEKMRVMSEKPLNVETPNEYLRSWIKANSVFFDRNQGEIPQKPIAPGRLGAGDRGGSGSAP